MRLTTKRLEAIISALTFCLADDWDEASHEHDQETHEAALSWALGELRRRRAKQAKDQSHG